METVLTLFCWGSKITEDVDYSHEIKRHLLLGRKVMTNLDSILESRDIPLPTKIHLVKAMVFPVVIYGSYLIVFLSTNTYKTLFTLLPMVFPVVIYECDSWIIKKVEHQKNGCFCIVMLEKTLENPFESKEIKPVPVKGNQS